ncbi:hypothetical protein [Streptomyces sp. H27-S2]|uniref:hypothetical protein n=1 Tax=Streptomyces antarcticus TaxID=2996458 RepID=UPI00226E3664|nr:hypothetical protein [Streptomyces sp. H27-S2]MCY0949863.1 hypothetical protein [Streptomyces sp. H27-S2]
MLMFSSVHTALAVAGHHLVFGGTPSWGAWLTALLVLGATAWRIFFRTRSLRSHVAGGVVAQAGAMAGFHADTAAIGEAAHGDGGWAVGYLACMVLVAWMLHLADADNQQLYQAAQQQLAALTDALRCLLFPLVAVTDPGVPLLPGWGASHERAPAAHEAMLADAVVRRGPPALRLPAV